MRPTGTGVQKLMKMRDIAAGFWDLAVDTAEEGRRDRAVADREAAMRCWADVIDATRRGDVRAALEALDTAETLFRRW